MFNRSRNFFSPSPKLSGFTLIELSIVLIIIGLIIGGILVGQDMIKSAELRATAGQVEKYRTAVYTFQGKYNCLPGDCLAWAQYGLEARNSEDGTGDGDGRIEGCHSGVSHRQQCGENILFWSDLSDAALIEGNFSAATCCGIPAITSDNLSLYYPTADLGRNNVFIVFNTLNVGGYNARYANYFYLGSLTGLDMLGYANVASPRLTPVEAYGIDIKIDDGQPHGGAVTGGDSALDGFGIMTGGGDCVYEDGTTNYYKLNPDLYPTTNELVCVMNLRI